MGGWVGLVASWRDLGGSWGAVPHPSLTSATPHCLYPQSLPPKNEHILRVGMTPLQRQYYRWILSRNFKELNKVGAASVLPCMHVLNCLVWGSAPPLGPGP